MKFLKMDLQIVYYRGTMRVFAALLCLVILPRIGYFQTPDRLAQVKYSVYEPTDDGYYFSFKTTNGIERRETGVLDIKNGVAILRVSGKSQYIGPNDKVFEVVYTADENGYKPVIKESVRVEELPVKQMVKIGTAEISTLAGGNIG